MGNRLKIKLTIPNPCSEDWNKMTPQGDGRFCNRCSHIIRDFSTYSDRELIEFLSKEKGKVCGRFEETQLNREIFIQQPYSTSSFHKFVMSIALALGIAGSANSQNNVAIQKTATGTSIQHHKKTTAPIDDSAHQITGSVIDSSNSQPLSGAMLAIEHNGKRISETKTDNEGKYKFIISRSFIGSHLTLLVMYYGADEKTIKFKPLKFPLQIAPVEMHIVCSNTVVVEGRSIPLVTGRLPITGFVMDSAQIHSTPKKIKKHKKWLLF